tara:strand:- start:476 stop:1261 length:786 start_codon:yes stop_codon:yes gene_type:complete
VSIHSTAIVSPKAEISSSAIIGPYCIIDEKVKIGPGTKLNSHIVVGSEYGSVSIGKRNFIQSGAILGGAPQHLNYKKNQGQLEIGDDNRIGENVTINLGSSLGKGKTKIGNKISIMAYAHIGHDCEIQDNSVITNLTQLAGHVVIGEQAIISGMVPITQFVRIGRLSFVSANSKVNKDIIPFTIADGEWAIPKAINKIGLKRASIPIDSINNIEKSLKILLSPKYNIKSALHKINEEVTACSYIKYLIEFVERSKKGVARK